MKCCEVSNPASSHSGASATLPTPGTWEGGRRKSKYIAGMERLDILPVTLKIEYIRGCFLL